MKIFAVIMAGGSGTRFWPRSTEKRPKQLLKIFDDTTMIQATVQRINGIVNNEDIFVVTNKMQKPEIVNQLPDVPQENIIEEPFGKNTAACIGLASLIVKSKQEDGVMVILPSDHIIKNAKEFHRTLKIAIDFAHNSGGLVTIGITPSRPETGYGYIQIDEAEIAKDIFKVNTFAEKPNYSTAVRFLESGDFFWNSGMFIMRADIILEEFKIHMPELYEGLKEIETSIGSPDFQKTVANVYGKIRSVSIDYGVMEKSQRVYLTKGSFMWSDVGSWEEVYQLSEKNEEGNAKVGNIYTEMTVDSYIYSPKKFASVIGVDNLIIINTEDALLVCRRDQAQNVKKVVDHLRINKLNEYL